MKKIILRVILFAGVIFSNSLRADNNPCDYIEISGGEVFVPKKLGNIKLYKDSDGFHVIKDDKIYDVQKCFCDPMLRKMSNKQLRTFLGRNKPKIAKLKPEQLNKIKKLIQKNKDNIVEIKGDKKNKILKKLFGSGYISVSQMGDGEYRLRAHGRLRGGAWWSDWDKILFIAGSVLIMGVACAATGGAAGALIAVGLEKSCVAGACLGAGIGFVVGGVTGGVLGNRYAPNTQTSVNNQTPANNQTSGSNLPQANTTQHQPLLEIPRIHNPFRENLRSGGQINKP